MIVEPMPSGVEHRLEFAALRSRVDVIVEPMPSGVEHRTWPGAQCQNYCVIVEPMPSGVEHSSSTCGPALRPDGDRRADALGR